MNKFFLTHEDMIDLLNDLSKWFAVVFDLVGKFGNAFTSGLLVKHGLVSFIEEGALIAAGRKPSGLVRCFSSDASGLAPFREEAMAL
ncbi:hypothetical protein [Stieleria magnilauensis]|uniref:Uncharacterized protein n=1 Tax=Stieleria magnilauensis TaxID=2527963 RepID=A0ABX5XYU1_9BACT|nr:hypothetical protein TBK1r_48770 [Planctomycetes bacterium TBK1r]